MLLHVTAGVGTTGPLLMRVNCPPEVAILELHRSRDAQ
jgi:predicted MPP superfamily phosphohydrolase